MLRIFAVATDFFRCRQITCWRSNAGEFGGITIPSVTNDPLFSIRLFSPISPWFKSLTHPDQRPAMDLHPWIIHACPIADMIFSDRSRTSRSTRVVPSCTLLISPMAIVLLSPLKTLWNQIVCALFYGYIARKAYPLDADRISHSFSSILFLLYPWSFSYLNFCPNRV